MYGIFVEKADANTMSALEYRQLQDPEPHSGEVVIKIAASGVNRADILQRRGLYPPPGGESPILGLECSGTIAAIGPNVAGWEMGQEVCALLAGGGYAEKVSVPAGQVIPVPQGVDIVEAAALPEAVCTVWTSLFALAQLSPGERLLVHGGSGGIGTMAIQLGRFFGAEVFCTSSAEKSDACRGLGAHHVIDYKTQDFSTFVQQHGGVDVILDVMGAKYLERNVDALASDGRIVMIGLQGGREGTIDLANLLNKRGALLGTTLRSRTRNDKARIVAEVRDHVWPTISAGHVRPVVDRVFALGDAGKAHEYMQEGAHIGKILLVP